MPPGDNRYGQLSALKHWSSLIDLRFFRFVPVLGEVDNRCGAGCHDHRAFQSGIERGSHDSLIDPLGNGRDLYYSVAKITSELLEVV